MTMKIFFAILFLIVSFVSNAQFTTIIDTNFEHSLINLGYDNILDSIVFTGSIDTITHLDVSNQNISNLSGIENFSNLKYLNCSNNNLDSLNINQNNQIKKLDCSTNNLNTLNINNLSNLDVLDCSFNNITSINLLQNIELDSLECSRNKISTLEVNTNLGYLYCGDNDLTSLDLSSMIFNGLHELRCENNPISSINLSGNYNLKHLTCHNNLLQEIDLNDNGNLQWLSIGNNSIQSDNNNNLTHLDLSNNCNITNFYANGNLNLYCIQVCDTTQTYSWITNLNTQQYFSENCNYTSINNAMYYKKNLISIKDVFGRESSKKYNSLLFFQYQNGMIEKRIILDK